MKTLKKATSNREEMEEATAVFVQELKAPKTRRVELLTQIMEETIAQRDEPLVVMNTGEIQKLRLMAFRVGASIEVINELDMIIIRLETLMAEAWQKALLPADVAADPANFFAPSNSPIVVRRQVSGIFNNSLLNIP